MQAVQVKKRRFDEFEVFSTDEVDTDDYFGVGGDGYCFVVAGALRGPFGSYYDALGHASAARAYERSMDERFMPQHYMLPVRR